MAINPVTFGRVFSDGTLPITSSGQSGWFSVPRQWYAKQDPDCAGRWIVSPNSNYVPAYYAQLGDDLQTMVYQDLILEKTLGISQ
jgi:hypothetical protein